MTDFEQNLESEIEDESQDAPEIHQDSILDKVFESQKVSTASLEPEEIISAMINQVLDSREQTVLQKRHGLNHDKITLEEIGKTLSVTRERVRQIAKQALKKLVAAKSEHEHLHSLDIRLKDILESSGGLKEQESLLSEFFSGVKNEKQSPYIIFFLDNLSELIKKAPFKKNGWHLTGAPTQLFEKLESLVKSYLENESAPKQISDIHTHLQTNDEFGVWQTEFGQAWPAKDEHDWENVLEAYLELSESLASNPFDEWGLVASPLVKPKRMGDKIYLVLNKKSEPLHFNDITTLINEYAFDHRKAYSPTVHNELILDDRFVLVGRGIYALKEWGYKAGTVTEVLARLLKNSEGSLSREELVEQVLKERMVKEGTILLALTDKDKFTKSADGKYTLIISEN